MKFLFLCSILSASLSHDEQRFAQTYGSHGNKRNSIALHAWLTQVQKQRAGAPIFDTIVELERGQVNKWTIVRNVDLAVDAILSGKPYKVEQRTRIPHDSGLQQAVSAS